MNQRYKSYLNDISSFVSKDRIYTDDLRLLAWGTDAGFYRMIPKIVIRSKDESEVAKLLRLANSYSLPVTFRAAGTSLSGQAISDSILIVAGKNWEKYEVASDGESIKMQPGIIGEKVNEILKPYGKIFAPDPASKKSAMVGGIIINNASGMNCGTHANSDRVLKSVRIVFADGQVLDTGDSVSRDAFKQANPQFVSKIEEIRDRIMADSELVKRIKYKYAIKNVTGLNIYPFVLFNDPFDIIAHLMVGSEGTLGFISEVTMATSHAYPCSASAMLYFSDMKEACKAVVAMKKGPVHGAELLDKKSLSSVNDTTGEGLTAVLTETKADSKAELAKNIEDIKAILEPFNLYIPAYFTDKPEEYSKYWAIRSGIFPSVGGTREPGTTVLIEDIAFHIEDLPDATVDLQQMLEKHGYPDACIYGHALEGNYHFIIAQSFDDKDEVEKYRRLMEEVEHLVIDKYDGSLKAEHGTGRNMAPFVSKEWGDKAFGIMKEIKALFDPKNLLNPGVIFNDDPECYIKGFKPMPLANPLIDKCIECGFCEVNCVTCGFSMSSRQRIILTREMARLRNTGEDNDRLHRLEAQFKYLGNTTCAGDGLCSTSCPMNINTGELIHDYRAISLAQGTVGYSLGKAVANNFSLAKSALRPVLSVASLAQSVIGNKGVEVVGDALHKLGIPQWTPAMPKAYYPHTIEQEQHKDKVVYFPSCINQTMGVSKNSPIKDSLVDKMVKFLDKCGYEVIFPHNMKNLCCGTIWESKGMLDIANQKSSELEAELLKATENGRYPVLCDQSPCLHRMREVMKGLNLYEPAEFIHDFLLDRLSFIPTDEPVAIHVTCSTRKMGLADKIIKIAKLCSRNVLIPEGVGCCGFAGDKGFTHPEVNEYALRKLRPQIEASHIKRGFSNSRTCEIGLSTNSGVPYQSIVYLVDECTTPKK
ncbi:MAG: FAD-binding and (Fe-S)-binding domain-containing protein [Muribaculaceae bacterium]|nr:FAD-binding and (Fe-S)-binding domain-containing protein [Muribaculaceae bacterium]